MFFAYIISNGLPCASVAGCCFDMFSEMGLVTVARQRDQKFRLLVQLLFRCRVGTNSGHNTGFQTIFQATGLVGTHNTLL